MACSGVFGTPGWVRTSGLSLRRRPLYPTELRGLIQKIFNFAGLQDSNDSIFRRRPLYPTELRGLMQQIFNFTGLQDSNDSIFRRRPLYPTELQTRMIKNILPFCQWICQCLICWERGGEKRLYSPPPSVIMGRKSGSDRRRRTEPVRNIEKRTVNLWTERRSSRAARCPRSSPGI